MAACCCATFSRVCPRLSACKRAMEIVAHRRGLGKVRLIPFESHCAPREGEREREREREWCRAVWFSVHWRIDRHVRSRSASFFSTELATVTTRCQTRWDGASLEIKPTMPSSHLFAAKFFIVSHGSWYLSEILYPSLCHDTMGSALIRRVPFKRWRLLFRFGMRRGKGDALPLE